jgi:hypothetical protein
METPSDDQKVASILMKDVEELIHSCVLEIVGYSPPRNNRPANIGMTFALNGSVKEVLELTFLNDARIAIIVSAVVGAAIYLF